MKRKLYPITKPFYLPVEEGVEVFCLAGVVASLAPGIAVGAVVSAGVLVGVAVTAGDDTGCGETGGWYLLRSQTKYPAITTNTNKTTTMETFLFK